MDTRIMESLKHWIYSYSDLELTFKEYYLKHKRFYCYENVLKLVETGKDKGSPPNLLVPELFSYNEYFMNKKYDSVSDDNFININYDISVVKHPRYFAAEKHRHDYYEVGYVFKGKAEQTVWAGTTMTQFTLEEGSFLIMPPSVYHSICVNDDSIVFNITLRKSACKETLLNNLPDNSELALFFMKTLYSDNPMYLVLHTDNSEVIKNSFFDIVAENSNNQFYLKELAYLKTSILFLNLLRHTGMSLNTFSPSMQDVDYIPTIISYLEQKYRTTSPQDIANRFSFSLTYIGRFYKKYTGKTLTESLQSIRLREASKLLTETSYKVSEISNLIGYADPTTFTKLFKRYYHVSPHQYRQINNDTMNKTSANACPIENIDNSH
jgi:AraC family cel operon transcriptional repressor